VTNQLFYGDNLDVRASTSPRSQSILSIWTRRSLQRGYNVIFAKHDTVKDADAAQIQAFDDTWRWTPVTEAQYTEYVTWRSPTR